MRWLLPSRPIVRTAEKALYARHNAFGRASVAVGIHCVRHREVLRRIVQQPARLLHDVLRRGPDQPRRARLDALRAFRGFAHDEHGLAQGGRLLLHSTGVRQDEPAARHQRDEVPIALRGNQRHVGNVAEQSLDVRLHVGIEMHRIDEPIVGVAHRKRANGFANLLDARRRSFRADDR